jgi:hypothetical protein
MSQYDIGDKWSSKSLTKIVLKMTMNKMVTMRKLEIRFPVRTAALVEESRQCSTIHMALLSYNPILYYYHMI